jgi:hypothetical protein
MSDRIRWLHDFHQTLNFGSRENLKGQQSEARRIYKALTHDEVHALLETALADADPKQRYLRHVLPCLACLQPGSLNRFHDRLIEISVFYPGVIYHAATDDVSRRLLPLIDQSTSSLTLNHLLLALAWTGNEVAVSSFAAWRRARPVRSSKLHVAPHEYTERAGWELTSADMRRDLFYSLGFPLVARDKDVA